MNNIHPVQVIAITGGKGGIGKTNVSINLSMALANLGRRVVLMDADLGLANVDILLGLQSSHDMSHVLSGQCSLRDVLLSAPGGIKIIPASSGLQEMTMLSTSEHAGLIHAFSDIADQLDTLVIDTAAGISDLVINFVQAAQEAVVVVCNEPASITDAYALIKVLNQDSGIERFHILSNMTRNARDGQQVMAKLSRVTNKFLDVTLIYTGEIPYDDNIRKTMQKHRAIYEAIPGSKASVAFNKLAREIDKWPLPSLATGQLEFFIERLIQSTA